MVDVGAPLLGTVADGCEVAVVVEELLEAFEAVFLVRLVGVEDQLLFGPVLEVFAGGEEEAAAVIGAVLDR